LTLIHELQPKSTKDLFDLTDTPRATLFRQVKKLREDGFVKQDVLELTDAGLERIGEDEG
jgi:DNA-binding IclR family transcriptional regulator